MVRSIKLKFMLTVMVSLFLVSLFTVLSINILNYYKINKYADSVINILAEPNVIGEEATKKEQLSEPLLFPSNPHTLEPASDYQAKYFIVHIKDNGDPIATKTAKDPLVTHQDAIAYSKQAKIKISNSGYIGTYRYSKRKLDDGTKYIFLDCSSILTNFRSFLYTSIEVAIGGLVIAFLLLLLHGQRIANSIAAGYEKQKRFITNANHEMKTPIAIISTDVEALLYEIDDNQWTQDIIKQTKRLSKLINELVYLSKMEESYDRKKYYSKIQLSELAEDIATSFEGKAKVSNATYSYYVDPNLKMRGNEEEIRILFSSLLDNAFNNMSEEGLVKLFLIGSRRSIRFVVFNTTDDVSREDIPHLFERFYRTDSSRSKRPSGSGIGLSIAKAIVDAHKGSIKAVQPDSDSFAIIVDFY